MRPAFPFPLLLASLLLPGCLPHFRVDPALAAERDEWREGERAHPEDPAYPRALFAVCQRLSTSCSVPSEPPLLLTEKVGGSCCMGALGFAGDVLLVTPLRALRTLFTMPLAWAQEARYRRESGAALRRWKALEPEAASP